MSDADRPDPTEPDSTDDAQRSGLKDPQRAIAALGAVILGLESLVLLLALVPLRMLRVEPLGPVIAGMLVLTVACIVVAGLIRRGLWAWHLGTAIQLLLVVGGFFLHWAIVGIGLIFACTWLYALSLRNKLSQPPVR